MWISAISALEAVIFALGHFAANSLGAGIFLTSFLLRLALLPLSIRLARRAERHQAALAKLRPELERLKARFPKDPVQLQEESFALFKRHGVSPVDGTALVGGLLQWPPLAAMYAAIRGGVAAGTRFVWIADLTRPDAWLVAGVTGLTVVAATLAMPAGMSRNAMISSMVISALLTGIFLVSTSSAMGLSMAASTVVSMGQGWWLRRERSQAAAA